MSKRTINWGIVGLGNIAHKFAEDLSLISEANLLAVASRTEEKAKAFASLFSAEKYYASYMDLFEDPEIDIVYIATPHHLHTELSIKAMQAGKHVLCEKPLAMRRDDALSMIDASKENNKFFMEAFWTRFNPSLKEVLQKVKEGEIGEVTYINADFAFFVDTPKSERLVDLKLGGGTLLDIGVYPLFLSYVILGMPESILAKSKFYDSGADKQTSMILDYPRAHAVLHSSFMSSSKMTATISGTKGRIHLHPTWHETHSYSIVKDGQEEEFSLPLNGRGYTYEIEECHKCLNLDVIESDLWSHNDSLNLITIVDTIKKQIGLEFPK